MTRRQIIWSTVVGLMLVGIYLDRLTGPVFFALLFVGGLLSSIFREKSLIEAIAEAVAEAEKPTDVVEEAATDVDDIIRIRRGAMVQFRNALLRHHELRRSDRAYQESAAARETTQILQILNAALTRRVAARP